MDHKTSSSENMEPSEISRSQLPNTSISDSPFLNNKGLKLRKKKTQTKLTYLKNPYTKKIKNSVSENVSSCDELKSEEDSKETNTLSSKDQTSCGNGFSENMCNNQENAVSVCPVCWKTFQKGDKISHMKSCATKHNLTLKQLLNAVDLQTKQIEERKTLGLPCVPTSSTVKKVSSVKNSSASNKIDPDLQLGLALSVSMSENEEQKHLMEQEMMLEAGLGDEVAANQASLLEKFGFTSTRPIVPSIYMQIRSGKHKFKTTPLLWSRTQDERERLITEKVAIILSRELGNKLQSPFLELKVTEKLQSEGLLQLQNNECTLWKQASLSPDSNHNSYYVEDLSYAISPTKTTLGSKLKHISQVPFRLKSPDNAYPMDFKGLISNESPSNQDIVHLSVNNNNLNQRESGLQFVSEKEIKDKTDTTTGTNCELSLKLANDWKTLLNNRMKSDLLIYVKDGQKIFAHELVLFVRCPNVLQDIKEKYTIKYINWNEISFSSALAFLDYVYSGSLSKINELDNGINEIVYLSEKYCVQDLSNLKGCMDVNFEENRSVSFDSSKDRTSDLCDLQNPTVMTVDNCMTEGCKEVKLDEERERFSISSSDCVTSNRRNSPVCVYSTVDSNFHYKSSLSPDPFIDICDPEVTVIPQSETSSTSESQQHQENLVDVLESNNESTECVSTNLQNEFHDERTIASDTSNCFSTIKICISEKAMPLNYEDTSQKINLSSQTHKSEHKDKESKCNAKISGCGEELNCEEVIILEETSRTLYDVPSVEKKRRNSDCNNSPCSKHVCNNARKSVRKSLLDKFSSKGNDIQPKEEDTVNFNFSQNNCLKSIEVSSNESLHDAVKELLYSQRELNTDRKISMCSPGSSKKISPNRPIFFNEEKNFDIQNWNDDMSVGNFCAEDGYQNFSACSSPCNEDLYVCLDENERIIKTPSKKHRSVVKSVENNCKSPFSSPLSVKSLPVLDSPYLLSKIGSSTRKFTLPRTRSPSPSEISVKSGKSSPASILVKCLSQTSIHLKSSHDDITQQTQIVPSAGNIESNFLKENFSSQKALLSPSTPSTEVLKTSSRSLNSVKRLLEDSFSIELEKNFLERKGDDFKTLTCSTPITAVPKASTLNKQLESVKAEENCITPMADYSGMDTPMLKRELQKYGLKPLKRKRAKQILRHIYNELHPLVPAHQSDDKLGAKSSQCSVLPMTSPRKKYAVKSPNIKPGKKGNDHPKQDSNCDRNLLEEAETSGNELSFPSSQESSSSLCEFEYPEDSSEEAGISESNESEVRSAVNKYITSDSEIYQRVLLYEPIWLELLQDALKADNCKFKVNHLLEVLDEECITYRSTQGIKSRQRKKKRKGKEV